MTKTQKREQCINEIARLTELLNTEYRDKRINNSSGKRGRPKESTSRYALILKLINKKNKPFTSLTQDEKREYWRVETMIRNYEKARMRQ